MSITFEDKLEYIEMVMGLNLLDWQKEALRSYDAGQQYFMYPGKAIGKTTCLKALEILKKLNESLKNNEGWGNNNPTFEREYEMRFE